MHPNAWQREMAQRILVQRKDPATVPFLSKLTAAGPVVARIHAIWTLEGMGALDATHLVPAIRSGDARLQASALWASTRLSAAELAKLAPVILAASPASSEVAPYFARALGPIGSPAAFDRLAKLVDAEKKIPFVREAAVSGLDQHEATFAAAHLKDSADRQLIEWLAQGGRTGTASAATDLTGPALASYQRGKVLFNGEAACFGCHGADGAGMPNLGPPLDESEWVTGKPEALVKILLHGMTGPVVVDGETYTPAADMPGLGMNPGVTDQSLADIAT
jgi:mono/diheme cytochrome c family protein